MKPEEIREKVERSSLILIGSAVVAAYRTRDVVEQAMVALDQGDISYDEYRRLDIADDAAWEKVDRLVKAYEANVR